MVKVKFLGAASTVTGSCYLVSTDNVQFLVDCGMFQGKDFESRNRETFDFDASKLDFVIVTHSHIDHIGLLPKLAHHGFKGEVFITNMSANLAYHLLLDAAKIQEGNSRGAYRTKKVKAIYNTSDALELISRFVSKNIGHSFEYKGVKIKFENAGHVLGAASVLLEVEGKRIVFSGDIGRYSHPFLPAFEDAKEEVDYVIMESLYGGKFHEDRVQTEKLFLEQLTSTLKRGGNVIIPTFAVQRAQELLYILKNAYRENIIKKDCTTFIDSPLAIKATSEYAQSDFGKLGRGEGLFYSDRFRFVMNSIRSLTKGSEPKIILAGSGMCEGGRILKHLAKNLPDPKSSIFIVGFQAEDTLGRKIVDGANEVLINKKVIPIRAQIHTFFGFSAHGDRHDLDRWLSRFQSTSLKKVFLVHAEIEQMELFKKGHLENDMYIPKWKEEVILG